MFERIISKGRRLEDFIQKKLDDLKDNHKFRGGLFFQGGVHLVIVFSWEIIYFHGQPNDNILSLDRVMKLSTEVLLMLLPKLHGFHQRTKHIEIDIHFVRDMVARGQVRVLHVPSRYQYADIFTKGLSSALFEEFHTSLSVRPSLAQTPGFFVILLFDSFKLSLPNATASLIPEITIATSQSSSRAIDRRLSIFTYIETQPLLKQLVDF
ncbi:ribonuclease H-like domain-containing protein [Tanacetum coccineum]